MNIREHLLVILAEECNEVAQRASKALRFGLDDVQAGQGKDNQHRLREEIADLQAVIEMCREHGILPYFTPFDQEHQKNKRVKVKHYLEYSRRCGTLTDSRKEGQ